MRYSEELDNLLLNLSLDLFPDVSNLLIEGMYSIFANYLTFLHHVDEVLRDQELSGICNHNVVLEHFIMSLASQSDHIYLLFTEDLAYNRENLNDVPPGFQVALYEHLLDDKEDQAEMFRLTEAVFVLSKVMWDIVHRDIASKLGEYALQQSVIPIYMNELTQFDGSTALQLIIYEPMG